MADLVGEDPEDGTIPPLERAIAYLCLPRRSPPDGPSVIGMEVFGGGVPISAAKKQLTSLHAASMAVVAAKRNRNGVKTKAVAKTTNTTGKQPRPATASAGEVTALPSSSPPSPPRQRSASPATIASLHGGRKSRKGASTATVNAAESAAAKASAKAAELLLPWDADSLASLLSAHRALAATLLRLERSSNFATDSATSEKQTSCKPSATTGAESLRVFDCQGVDQDHPLQSQQSTGLLKRAAASLTTALAAAEVGVRPVISPFSTDPDAAGPFPEAAGIRSKNSKSGVKPIFGGVLPPFSRPPSSPSRLSTPLKMVSDDEGGPCKSEAESRSPQFPASLLSPLIPVTGLMRDTDADHRPGDLEGEQSLPQPQGEAVTASSPPPGGGESDESWLPGQNKEGQDPRQRGSMGGDTTTGGNSSLSATSVVGSEHKTVVAELYSMRCAANEGLGSTEGALEDCRAALTAAPGAPKLWAKAASLALQLGSEAERREKRRGEGASTSAPSETWAKEVRQNEIQASRLLHSSLVQPHVAFNQTMFDGRRRTDDTGVRTTTLAGDALRVWPPPAVSSE